jgi:hypothetical protein
LILTATRDGRSIGMHIDRKPLENTPKSPARMK